MARSIFITGASSGIGEALARRVRTARLRRRDRGSRADRLEALASAAARPRRARACCRCTLDVTDFDGDRPALAARRHASSAGSTSWSSTRASVTRCRPAGASSSWCGSTLDTDLTGAIATIEHALPLLRAQGGGQIVAITSIAGVRGMPFLGAYSAAKAGLHRYLQALRAEVHHEPIVVTELAPGYIDTDMNRGRRQPTVRDSRWKRAPRSWRG